MAYSSSVGDFRMKGDMQEVDDQQPVVIQNYSTPPVIIQSSYENKAFNDEDDVDMEDQKMYDVQEIPTRPESLGQVDFGAEQIHYIGNQANSGATIYDLSASATSVTNGSIPISWIQNGTATQFNSFNKEELSFSNQVISNYTLNPPSIVQPIISGGTTNMQPPSTPAQYSLLPPVYQTNPITSTTSSADAPSSSSKSGSFNVAQIPIAAGGILKGGNMISKFWGVLGDEEATATLGDAAVETASGFASSAAAPFGAVVSEEAATGFVAGAAEALGGAAAVGGFIAGGEVIAGAALIGVGLYEGYQALGGSDIFSSSSNDVKKISNAFGDFGESISNWFP